jgi:hypothetical protein
MRDPIMMACNLILRSVHGIKLISEGHSLISLYVRRIYAGAPYKYLYGGAPYKSPKIAPPAAAAVVWPRARRTHRYRQKSLNCGKRRRLRRISEVQPDLRGSLIVPPTVKSSYAGPCMQEKYSAAAISVRFFPSRIYRCIPCCAAGICTQPRNEVTPVIIRLDRVLPYYPNILLYVVASIRVRG